MLIEINECERGTDLCEHTCTNTPGSYNCSCNTGYQLGNNNHSCSGMYLSYKSNIYLLFLDIDECSSNNGGCNQVCVNLVGSYYCQCNNGYTLSNNNHTCIGKIYVQFYSFSIILSIDNNECSTGNGGCEHNCTNSPGSYNCSCADGYSLNGDQHGCSR